MDPQGEEGCAIKVNTKEGDTFTLVNILKDGPVILNNQKCCGDFAIFAKRKGKNQKIIFKKKKQTKKKNKKKKKILLFLQSGKEKIVCMWEMDPL